MENTSYPDPEKSERNGLEIAIVGMSGRFPGANNLNQFWENLKNGVNSIRFFTEEELLQNKNIDADIIHRPNYVKAMGIIENPEYFDASFFGYSPLEAEILDPQIRVFSEICWEALEDAGCDPATYKGSIGLFAGGSRNRSWEILTLVSGKEEIFGEFAANNLKDKDYLTTRISHKLDLKGPATSMYTACSTALVATDLACRSLLTGQCDAALAGGVSVLSEIARGGGYLYEEGLIRSPDGLVRAFDREANGTVFSHGAGVVLLKRLDDAIGDGDDIYAVIKGFAANNDGTAKSSFTAPAVDGQTAVIRTALYMAEVEPETITYVEAHGTGTRLGDPIEIEALKTAFNTNKTRYCAIGSVKTNIGHLDTAAGVAGMIKVVLMMKHRQIPPSLNYKNPNPEIDFEHSPFFVNTQLQEWKSNGDLLRAGLSSFGVGGTNVHLILEQAPGQDKADPPARPFQLLLLSARTANALEQASKNFLDYLKENPHTNLADAAFTLNTGRKAFEHKKMLVCRDINEALEILEQKHEHEQQKIQTHYTKEEKRAIFMFPGQGSQYVDMARGLYETEPIFQQEMDRCFEILKPLMDYDLKEILYPHPDCRGGFSNPPHDAVGSSGLGDHKESPLQSNQINQTEIAQPLIFALEYALAKLLMAWGIAPYAMMGHSIGEYTAACLAGVFSLEHALFIVAWRGKLMQQMPPGSMLSVALPEPGLKQLLSNEAEGKLDLAAVNGPSQCVVSGTHEDIDAFTRQLEEKNIQNRKLHTSHAYHSKMMEPILNNFREKVSQVKGKAPQIPFISNLTGQWFTYQDAANPDYWVRHLRSTVRFADGLKELLKDKNVIFIEVGPGSTLTTFTRQHPDKSPDHMLIDLVRHPKKDVPDEYYLLSKLGQTWLYGKPIDWQQFYSREKRHRLHLPTYPFQRQRYWIEGNPNMMIRERMVRGILPGKKVDLSQWFYMPAWKPSIIGQGNKEESREETPAPTKWLVFTDDDVNDVNHGNFASALPERLTREKENDSDSDTDVTVVKIGDSFARHQDGSYTIAPAQEDHYETLIEELQSTGKIPDRIVHLWNLSPVLDENQEPVNENERVEKSLDLGFYSLIYLAKALGKHSLNREIHITVLTNGMQEVWGETVVFPEKAAVLAPIMIIPREYPEIKCRCIDIVLPPPGQEQGKQKAAHNNENEIKLLVDRLVREFKTGINDKDTIIAYRGNYRLVRTFEPIRLNSLDSQPPALRLKKAGVYLITGGLGGIGLVLARYLAKALQAKLILTGRSAFPARQEWDQWLDTHRSLDRISQKIRKIKQLEALGAEVQVYSVDSADGPAMSEIIAQTRQHFGTINGVIHSAGVPGGGIIQLKTREMADRVLAPKIKGTLALHRALQDQGIQPDFIALCSSVNSVVPVIGQVDYFAANAFMDAFAFYNNARNNDHTFTVSINWDAWQEVGMAVEAARQAAGENRGKTSAPQPLDHPLLDHYVNGTLRGETIYTTYFSPTRHWVLRDHRTNERRGLVPGVTYLEMAHAAIKNQTKTGNGIVEIRSVSFLNPLMVEDDEEQEVRMTLTPTASGFEFRVSSRLAPGENTWQDHARGEVAAAAPQEEEPKIHDLQAIAARCHLEEIDVASSWSQWASEAVSSLIIFGPRWACLKKIKAGKNEGLALLELPGEFSAELNQFTLYPAIMDHASVFLYSWINHESPYIPYSYKRLRVNAPLPARVYSYSQWLEEEDGAPMDFLKFNIIIMDETGRELVNIEEFTMLEVSPEILARLKIKEHSVLPDSASVSIPGDSKAVYPEETRQEELVKDGISPLEGVEIFTRILETRDVLPQVVVSTRDLASRLEASQTPESPDAVDWMPGAGATGPVHARPDISTPYIAPTTSLQQKIANIWQELLGIAQVGIKDDFFELGGDSLKAASLIARIKQEFHTNLSVRNIFNAPNVKDLSKLMEIPGEPETAAAVTSIKPLEKKEYYAVSTMQRRMYILNKMEGIATTYNLAFVIKISEKLNRQRLEQAFQLLIRRHESLRTTFDMKNGEPVQIIHEADDMEFRVEYLDYQGKEEEIKKLIRGFIRPFNLSQAPLMRVGIITLSEEKHLVILDVHHIAADGVSYITMTKNVDAIYGGGELPGLIIQYKEFSQWHNRELERDFLKKQKLYWLNEFKEEIPVLNLPIDYSRPVLQAYEGNTLRFTVDEEKTRKLKALALKENATLFMVLIGIFYAFLSKLSGQEDIVVGSPVVGRKFAELENIVGMFINMLPLRNYPTSQKTHLDFLKEIKEKTLEALENQEYPFEILLEELPIKRDLSRNPLFDVMFDLQNQLGPDLDLGNRVDYDSGISKFDITLTIIEEKEHLVCYIEYCTRLFKTGTIEKFIRYFNKTFSFLVENPGAELREIEILSEEEKQQLLMDFNDTATTYPKDKTLYRLFEEQADRTPDQMALVGKDEGWKDRRGEGKKERAKTRELIAITYKKLNEKSRQLTNLMRQKGVEPDTIVALMVERSVEMMVGLLGILKAGCAYLPIDPGYPEARIKYILTNSNTKVLVTTNSVSPTGNWAGVDEKIFIDPGKVDELPLHPALHLHPSRRYAPGTSLAYVIYTSGSTGNPKGVMVQQGNAINFIKGMTDIIDFSSGKTIAALTTISFDIFFLETLLAVICGLKVFIATEDEQRDPQLLQKLISRHNVDMLQLTPSRLKLLLDSTNDGQWLMGIKELLVGGEAFPPGLFKELKETFPGKIYNVYGPTETTIWSTVKDLSNCTAEALNIGRPICNTQIYILDRFSQPQPVGIVGELSIGGEGVARGYLNNPELTAKKFGHDLWDYRDYHDRNHKSYRSYLSYLSLEGTRGLAPLLPGKNNLQPCSIPSMPSLHSPIYKTGDLARWLTDGEIEFLGRADHQVKIRGFRIELEEIEEQLLNHGQIKEAVVIDRRNESGDRYLAAYLVPGTAGEENPVNVSELKEYLSLRLPYYMIPDYFVTLDKIPLTPNGKVNRNALPALDGVRPHMAAAYVPPESEKEKIIADIWKGVLKLEQVGIYDNFFDLGGNSLNVIQLNQDLNDAFGKDIPVAALFKYLTVSSFIQYLTREETGIREPDKRVNRVQEVEKSKDRLKQRRGRRG